MVKCVLYPFRDWAKTVKASHSTNGICTTVSKLRILRHADDLPTGKKIRTPPPTADRW
jgi:hypothetical protein